MERSKECGDKKRCLREINPEFHPGVCFGEMWKYEERWFGCYLCRLNLGDNKEKENEDQ